jgi:hypothetical protein
MRIKLGISVAALFTSCLSFSQNKTYYVSATGNDANDGLTTATAWQTIAKVNTLNLQAGDKVLFEGLSTFIGTILLDQNDNGTSTNPVTISSYGTGRATISSTTTALYLSNTGGIKISNLIFQGNNTGNSTGLYFEISQTTANIDYLYIDNIDVSRYNGTGLSIGASSTDKGFTNVTVTNSSFHDNGNAGMQTFNYPGLFFSHSNLYIGHCKFYDNLGNSGSTDPSGNGLVVSGVNGGTIEYCEAYNNGANNSGVTGGPVGIWTYDTKNVTIQYSESHHNKTGTTKDGGGFDIDGGSQSCTIQYCYSHDNDGPGFSMVEYGSINEYTGNSIRFNISQNDARNNNYGALLFYSSTSLPIKNSKVYNNTFYVSAAGLPLVTPSAVNLGSQFLTNIQVSNNIFYVTAGVDMLSSPYSLTTSDILFLNNDYYSASGVYHFKWGGTDYASLNLWKSNAGQETDGTTSMGMSVEPMLVAVGTGATVAPAGGGSFNSLSCYYLTATSPLIDQGLYLTNMGPTDFFGSPIPQSSKYDIGAAEYLSSNALPLTITAFNGVVQGNNVSLRWKVYNEDLIQQYNILRSNDGLHFNKIGVVAANQRSDYSFTDNSPLANSFYRVQYLYPDGKTGTSPTLRISTTGLKNLSVSFNGGQGVQLRVWSDQRTTAYLHIYNSIGSSLYSSKCELDKGSNNILVGEATKWKAGTYFASVGIEGDSTQVLRFTKPF